MYFSHSSFRFKNKHKETIKNTRADITLFFLLLSIHQSNPTKHHFKVES